MLEVLKEAQGMAGGRKRGQIVFWTVGIIFVWFAVSFLLWWTKPAYDNFSEFLAYFNINIRQVDVSIPSSFWVNLLLSFVVTTVSFAFLAGVGAVIGVFFAMFINVLFSPFTTYRIDKIFTELIPLIKKTNDEALLDELNKLHARWNRSRFTRLARFLTSKKVKEKYAVTKI